MSATAGKCEARVRPEVLARDRRHGTANSALQQVMDSNVRLQTTTGILESDDSTSSGSYATRTVTGREGEGRDSECKDLKQSVKGRKDGA